MNFMTKIFETPGLDYCLRAPNGKALTHRFEKIVAIASFRPKIAKILVFTPTVHRWPEQNFFLQCYSVHRWPVTLIAGFLAFRCMKFNPALQEYLVDHTEPKMTSRLKKKVANLLSH